MGRKLAELLGPFWGAGFPSNTVWPGPSGILIHPTVWLQHTNVTDRQERQRSDSIGRPFENGGPKTTLTGKFSRFCTAMIHHLTDRCVVFKLREIWSTGNL